MRIRRQNGLTLVGFLIVLVVVIFFTFLVMRIGPMYLEYHAVVSALKTLQADPGAKDLAPQKIRQRILDSLYLSYAYENVQGNHIKVTRSQGVRVRVVYEVRKPLMGNLDVIGSFDKAVVLR